MRSSGNKPYGRSKLKNGFVRVQREVSPQARIFLQAKPLDSVKGVLVVARKCKKSFVVISTDATDNCWFYYEIKEPPNDQ